mmetsp:Transcript_70951/g.169925  ORF Transcript_70951/g.169925 Transcript_70951/m.169925 type:complete len:361 (+) Transcript_70951:1176-2258(+)
MVHHLRCQAVRQERWVLRLGIVEDCGNLGFLVAQLLPERCLSLPLGLEQSLVVQMRQAVPLCQGRSKQICPTSRWPHYANAHLAQLSPLAQLRCHFLDVGNYPLLTPPVKWRACRLHWSFTLRRLGFCGVTFCFGSLLWLRCVRLRNIMLRRVLLGCLLFGRRRFLRGRVRLARGCWDGGASRTFLCCCSSFRIFRWRGLWNWCRRHEAAWLKSQVHSEHVAKLCKACLSRVDGCHGLLIQKEAGDSLHQLLLCDVAAVHTEVVRQLGPLENHMSHATRHVSDVDARNEVRSIAYQSQAIKPKPGSSEQAQQRLLAITIWKASGQNIGGDALLLTKRQDLSLYQLPLQELGGRNPANVVL